MSATRSAPKPVREPTPAAGWPKTFVLTEGAADPASADAVAVGTAVSRFADTMCHHFPAGDRSEFLVQGWLIHSFGGYEIAYTATLDASPRVRVWAVGSTPEEVQAQLPEDPPDGLILDYVSVNEPEYEPPHPVA